MDKEMEASSVAAVTEAKSMIKLVALCGSLRKSSFHRGLIRSAIKLCHESINGIQLEYVDIESLPFINTDLKVDGTYPPVVEAFRQKILESDSILFASPEYNFSVAPLLKNAIDWASCSPNVWSDKTAAIISVGYDLGGARSQYHLRQIGVCLDLHFINTPEMFVYGYNPPKKFDSDGNLIDLETKERLKQVLLSLQALTLRLQNVYVERRSCGRDMTLVTETSKDDKDKIFYKYPSWQSCVDSFLWADVVVNNEFDAKYMKKLLQEKRRDRYMIYASVGCNIVMFIVILALVFLLIVVILQK